LQIYAVLKLITTPRGDRPTRYTLPSRSLDRLVPNAWSACLQQGRSPDDGASHYALGLMVLSYMRVPYWAVRDSRIQKA
jgi:hypothetical protein